MAAIQEDNRKSGNARHLVRDAVQTMILEGQKKPGTKLTQPSLAKQFGVAQGVVREALLELQSLGLVESIDNRGMFVTGMSMEKLLESWDVREMHEGLIARLCCDHITRAQIQELRAMAEKIFLLGDEGNLDEMGKLDRKWHHALLEVSGNSMLKRLADNYRVLGKVVRANRDPRAVWSEHMSILDAVEQGDSEQAEFRMRQHIRAGRLAIEKQIIEGSFVPQWVQGD
ncbi:MAG: GntR family transcriptional regulator [Phycisphaerae bacterium]|nr:GntR family transcriptional regulator [Phycisphaerae bacterium]